LSSAEKAWIETGVGFSSYGLNRTDVNLLLGKEIAGLKKSLARAEKRLRRGQ
jgi:hypothetical protein